MYSLAQGYLNQFLSKFDFSSSKFEPDDFPSSSTSCSAKHDICFRSVWTYNILIWENVEEISHTWINYSKCGACQVIFDRKRINEFSTKAIVYQFWQTEPTMPHVSRSEQLQVWFSMESAPALLQRKLNFADLDNVFNLTMSYRRDSDVYFPHGVAADVLSHLQKISSGSQELDIEYLVGNKTGHTLWVVSNCGYTLGARKRSIFAYSLVKAGLRLDKRGRCSIGRKPIASVEIAKYYKFYLAFENSYHCKDYITEKAFVNALTYGAVPIVWGARKSDYEALLPPGSYIFAEDYKSPEKLVAYVEYLDKTDAAYKAYFNWRTLDVTDMPMHNRTSGWCQLCRILHGINIDNAHNPRYNELRSYVPSFGSATRSRIVPSLKDWFYGEENKECITY